MKEIILGTAGHIDHGKTSLIKALTGTETDRLKEEKSRGITIELGFASLDLPSGQHVGIVDVPGHERFIKNMVAGATGIDLVAMIIAADEGVMPQTREHMDICTLLGIRHGLVVLTKTDLVDEEWRELVQEDIAEFTEGTFLENAPIVPVSSATGEGLDDLISTLDTIIQSIPERDSSGLFRISVDRVFTMKGFGTVITGTLASGSIAVGDTVSIYPTEIVTKIRGMQVHGSSVEKAVAGMRTAINFQGVELSSVNRGDVVALPGALSASYLLDVEFHYLASNEKPIKNRTKVRVHTGTTEIHGNLILLDKDQIEPGETALVQLRLDTPVTTVKDDRCVIRSYSPSKTVGGGAILNPVPVKHKRFREDISEGLKKSTDNDLSGALEFNVKQSGYKGVKFDDLKLMTNVSDKKLDAALSSLMTNRDIIMVDKDQRQFVHKHLFSHLCTRILNLLEAYHQQYPLKEGMLKEEVKSKLPPLVTSRFFNLLLSQLTKNENIVVEETIVRLSGHTVSLQTDQEEMKSNILHALESSGLMPPSLKQLATDLNIDAKALKDVLLLLIKESKVVKVKDDLYFHIDAIQDLENKLVTHLREHTEIDTPAFKDMTGASRKYVIPLIEYFDSTHVTIRVGDMRQLRKKG